MTTPSPNPVGPELTGGPSATVTSHMTPRSSPFHWSTVRPTIQGWYWARRPNVSNNGWDTRAIKTWAPPGQKLRGAWQHDLVVLMDDVFWNVAQFSFEPIPEPLS